MDRLTRLSPRLLSPYMLSGHHTWSMANRLEIWARAERAAIQEDIKNLEASGKVISPGGDEITATTLEKLIARLEQVDLVLKEVEDAHRT